MKRGWYKNRENSEVLFCEGRGHCDKAVVVRNRDGSRAWMWKSQLVEKYEPIKASGFPSLRPKEFQPRYAVHDRWSDGEAFVMEFEPGKFKIVMKDGQEELRGGEIARAFSGFFDNGPWKLVSEAEALARLDKPKPPVPAAEQFGVGPWYGAGLKYVYCPTGFYVYKGEAQVGWVSYEVVQNLWNLNMVSKERPKSTIERVSAILDVPKTAFKPKKVLVEWAIRLKATPNEAYYTRLFPEGASPAVAGQKCFKTGRTVEVQE